MKAKTHNTWLVISLLTALSLVPWATQAEETLDLSVNDTDRSDTRFHFSEQRLGGFERKRVSNLVRMRGWQVRDGLYFGQAKVDKKWGLGFVYDAGDTVYGLNNRGIQVMKRF